MFETRHPDSTRLLAWLDRELDVLNAWRVKRHVARCWQCRGRVAEFESAISAVGEFLEPAMVKPVDLAKARWKFRAAAADAEQTLHPPRRLPILAFGAAAAAAALCVAVLMSRSQQPQAVAQLGAESWLAKARAAETPELRAAVREERFTVEYSDGAKSSARRELRILSSPQRGAWTARWSTEQGVLESALYAGEAQEFTKGRGFRPAVFHKSDTYRALFQYASSDGQNVERMILDWIRNQAWKPVSFAQEVAEFCARSGAVLKISTDGTAVLWTAESALDGTRVQVNLEAIRGQAPAVLRIAWQARETSGVVKLKREWKRDYDDLRLAATLLYAPPTASSSSHRDLSPPPAAVATTPAIPSLGELLSAEVAVLRSLHAAGLCSADEVQVARTAEAVEVKGTVTGDEQRERIIVLLSGIPHLRVQLTRFDVGTLPLLRQTEKPVEHRTQPAAAEAWLRSRLGVGVRISEREMFNTMGAVISNSEDLLSNSWALLRLSQRFPVQLEREMDSETRVKLRQMADDHTLRMGVHLAAIDARLALQQASEPAGEQFPAWQTASQALHDRAKHTAEALLMLFAGRDILSRSSSGADPEQVGVATLIGRVRSMVSTVRTELATEFRSARE